MAVIVKPVPSSKYYYTFGMQTIDPEDDARIKAGEAWFEAERLRYFEETEDSDFLGVRKSIRPWQEQFLPRKVEILKIDQLPDCVFSFPGCSHAYSTVIMVSPRFKAVIESVQSEADDWTFFPVELQTENGEPHETYFIWGIHKILDALDESAEGLKSVGGGALRFPHQLANYNGDRSTERQRVRKSVVQGVNAWIDYRFSPAFKFFISDALYQAMIDAELSNFKAESFWGEV